MFSCILGLGAAFGIMFMLGMEYNQTHHILPFIAIGIGIDDMFVIMECWYNLLEQNKGLPLPERASDRKIPSRFDISTSPDRAYDAACGHLRHRHLHHRRHGLRPRCLHHHARPSGLLCERCHLHCPYLPSPGGHHLNLWLLFYLLATKSYLFRPPGSLPGFR